MQAYFDQLDRVRYEGSKSSNPLAFRHYNPDELVLGKRMEEHLRFAACYWHTFCWNGADMCGVGAFNRPWQQPGEALALAKRKADVAFEFFHKLHVPSYPSRRYDRKTDHIYQYFDDVLWHRSSDHRW